MLPRKDAIFNLQRVLSLVHALQSDDDAHLRAAVQDRWHQPARAALVPLLREVLALEDPDVLGAFLSGAGPSVAVLARREFARLEQLLAIDVRARRVRGHDSDAVACITLWRWPARCRAHGRTV